MAATARFDVVVVGASIAGCTAARLFALAGARVGLIERRPDPAAYKVVCTHQILSSAVPTIERMGLAPFLEARGAVHTHAEKPTMEREPRTRLAQVACCSLPLHEAESTRRQGITTRYVAAWLSARRPARRASCGASSPRTRRTNGYGTKPGRRAVG
jgi:2-polyprenyl-6-methoxyphenol hydroxylase-like FAD-dependent oxidoreductase